MFVYITVLCPAPHLSPLSDHLPSPPLLLPTYSLFINKSVASCTYIIALSIVNKHQYGKSCLPTLVFDVLHSPCCPVHNPSLFSQNYDCSQNSVRTSQAAAATVSVQCSDTKLENISSTSSTHLYFQRNRMLGVTPARQVGLHLLRGVSRRSMSAAALPQPITEPDVKVKRLFY